MAPPNPSAPSDTGAAPLVRAQLWLAERFDRLADPARVHGFERLMVVVAIIGFVLHLALIWACITLPALAPLARLVGRNYLSAIYTPFSFILFYELLLLVLTIPESTTLAVGRQYEIISLITVRNVFKDLAEFETLSQIETQIGTLQKVLIDLAVGVLLFLLVGVFYHINRWRKEAEPQRPPRHGLDLFIAQKKIVAAALSILFFVLLAGSVWTWGSAFVAAVAQGGPQPPTLTTIFYTDIFTVLVFSDVLLLLLSLLLSDSYPLVFRNAGFVCSTILLRLALAAVWPYNLLASVAAVACGLLVNLIYLYSTRVALRPAEHS